MQSDIVQNSYVFVLGREQEIALAEVKAVLTRFGFVFAITSVSGNCAFINVEKSGVCGVENLADILGGTVKIFKIEQPGMDDEHRNNEQQTKNCHSERSEESSAAMNHMVHGEANMRSPRRPRSFASGTQDDILASKIASIIKAQKQGISGKLNFGISAYAKGWSEKRIQTLGLEVKQQLKSSFSVRFVAPREGSEIASIVSLKNHLNTKGIEIGIFDNAIGVLVGLSNAEEWSKRDYGKPAGDKYSGMVPPKLARAMVNIALVQQFSIFQFLNANGEDSKLIINNLKFDNAVIVDPFCGSGNILMEALMLGYDVVGSDISEKAVRDTKTNLEWLSEEYPISNIQYPIEPRVFQSDATSETFIENLKFKIKNLSEATIVTEPYLGQPKKFKPSYNSARGEYQKIQALYLSFLRNLSHLDQKNINLCLVFPLVETVEGRQYSLFKESVDEIRELGYTQVRPPLIYGRDYQVVKREIVFLKF